MNGEPVVTGAAVSAALVALVGVLAVIVHLEPTVVVSLNSAVAAVVLAISAIVRSKVTPMSSLPTVTHTGIEPP
jgi:hypothetical protein